MSELLPCPFCGGEPKLLDLAGWEMHCDCGCDLWVGDDPSREAIIAAWNRRATLREPTMKSVICGFESVSEFEDSDLSGELSGCRAAAMAARICWRAMLEERHIEEDEFHAMLTDEDRAMLALTSEHGAPTASTDSQNTTAQMTQAVASDPVAVAGRAPVAQSGEHWEKQARGLARQCASLIVRIAELEKKHGERIDRPSADDIAAIQTLLAAAAPIADEAREPNALDRAVALLDERDRFEHEYPSAGHFWNGADGYDDTGHQGRWEAWNAAIAAERGETK